MICRAGLAFVLFVGVQPFQSRPPGVDYVVRVLGVVGQASAALRAQPRAIGSAQRRLRQGQDHSVPHWLFEVDHVVDYRHVVLSSLGRRLVVVCGIDEELLDINDDGVADGIETPCTLAHDGRLRDVRNNWSGVRSSNSSTNRSDASDSAANW